MKNKVENTKAVLLTNFEKMKIQVPIDYNQIEITKNNHFIAKNDKDFFMIELPTPINTWWIDGYYTDEKFSEVILVDSDWGKEMDMQRYNFLKELSPDEMLAELLATIHGDGGHHTEKVGLARSVFDAEVKLGEIIQELEILRNKGV